MSLPPDTGVVLIGRNEGDRLKQAVTAALRDTARVCYVDSGSTDDSVAFCRSAGVRVVELDLGIPFTAARARNAGFAELLTAFPELALVQFIDGDAELEEGWLGTAREHLLASDSLAVVYGRRRERYPDATIYNRICDIEWDAPAGEALYCGGDAMFSVAAFQSVGGYNPTLIAGEEPEFCVRLRAAGWRIECLARPMTIHDADMHRASQWASRMRRAGHAFAEGAVMHGRSPARHFVRETAQALFWGAGLPAGGLVLAPATDGVSLAIAALGYGVSGYRSYRHTVGRVYATKTSAVYAASCVLGKFPQAMGALELGINRLLGRRRTLIEYKGATGD